MGKTWALKRRRTIYTPNVPDSSYRLLNRTTGEVFETPDFATLIQTIARDIAYRLGHKETVDMNLTFEKVEK